MGIRVLKLIKFTENGKMLHNFEKMLLTLIYIFILLLSLGATSTGTSAAPNSNFTADFSATPTSGAAPLTVQFTGISNISDTTWEWDFNSDGILDSTLKNPLIVFKNPGNYDVTLRVKKGTEVNVTEKPNYITVSNIPIFTSPVSSFTASVTTGNVPLTVTFTDQSTGSPTSWLWDFGDGAISNLQSPTHTYTQARNYTVRLTTTNAGGSNTTTRSSYIIVTAPAAALVAAFNTSTTSGNAPLTVTFTDRSTGSPASWSWNFGDGTTSTIQNPTHIYTSVGTYAVTLTASKSGGVTSSASSSINVTSSPSVVANFSSNVSSGVVPLTVQFNDLSSGSPTSWNWNFGDGSASTLQNPVHTYLTPNTYTVILIAGNGNSWNTVTKYITAGNGLRASFTASLAQGPAPLTVQFTDISAGTPTSWSWDFGDGTSSSLQSPAHTYNLAGTYPVTLKVANNFGMNTSNPFLVNVSSVSNPVAALSSNVSSGNPPLTVQFNDTSTGNPISWFWDFGDGTNSTERDPIHTYSEIGSYSVTLNVSNNLNQHSTLTLPDYISVTEESGGSSDGSSDGSSGGSGGSSSDGTESSPELESNIEVRQVAQVYVFSGQHSRFEFAKNDNSIYAVEFDAKKTLGKIKATNEQLKQRSFLTPTPPAGKVIKFINIWFLNRGNAVNLNMENASIDFMVGRDIIASNGFNESTIVLERYDQGAWNLLSTNKTGGDDQYIYYQANTSGFSSFAITSIRPKTIKQVTQTDEQNISKFKESYDNQLSIIGKKPEEQKATNTSGGQRYSGIISFFVSFIVVLSIGLFIREKRK